MKYYKLLSQEMTSYNKTKWKIGVPVTISIPGNKMCTEQVLHCYNHPFLAVILNPVHADIENPRLFEIEVDEIVNSDGLKFASKSQTLIKEIPLPEISLEQKIEFAIKVAKLFFIEEKWNAWADKWLDGSDRSRESADTDILFTKPCDWYLNESRNMPARVAWAACWAVSGAINSSSCSSSAVCIASEIMTDKNEFNQKIIDIIQEIVKIPH